MSFQALSIMSFEHDKKWLFDSSRMWQHGHLVVMSDLVPGWLCVGNHRWMYCIIVFLDVGFCRWIALEWTSQSIVSIFWLLHLYFVVKNCRRSGLSAAKRNSFAIFVGISICLIVTVAVDVYCCKFFIFTWEFDANGDAFISHAENRTQMDIVDTDTQLLATVEAINHDEAY